MVHLTTELSYNSTYIQGKYVTSEVISRNFTKLYNLYGKNHRVRS